jgi:hypothetical protein
MYSTVVYCRYSRHSVAMTRIASPQLAVRSKSLDRMSLTATDAFAAERENVVETAFKLERKDDASAKVSSYSHTYTQRHDTEMHAHTT